MKRDILVVDDDKDIRELVKFYLETENYSVALCGNGEEALELIKKTKFDLIILDVMMPKMDGIETLINIRKDNVIPVIFLTAKGDEIDMVRGLTLGADDYISKPFSSMELLARVKAQLRRYDIFSNNQKSVITLGDMELDTDKHTVRVLGKDINLTPTEYRILELMCKNRNVVFTVEQIYEKIWRNKQVVGDTSIMVHITKIRHKIEKDPKNPEYIKTVWGVGYKIC